MWKYSNKNNLLFWHVPRTGGSYVEFVLSNYYDFNDVELYFAQNHHFANKFIF